MNKTRFIKTYIKKFLHFLGIEIIKYPVTTEHLVSLGRFSKMVHILSNYNISLVLDVGANTGQFAESLIEAGYKRKVMSFEPLLSVYEKLAMKAKSYSNWQVAERCAIGNFDGEVDINISKNFVSSSILPILNINIKVEPKTMYIGTEKVKIYKLDTIVQSFLKENSSIFLKIDVQGYEDKVLGGASKILPKIRGIELEMSFIPLYENQMLIEDMIKELRNSGFVLCDLFPAFSDNTTGRLLQVDGLFLRL